MAGGSQVRMTSRAGASVLADAGTGTHSTVNSASASPFPAASSCPAGTGRDTRPATDTTGAPVSSAATSARPAASGRRRTRSADAPGA